jgi:hypothetical protein
MTPDGQTAHPLDKAAIREPVHPERLAEDEDGGQDDHRRRDVLQDADRREPQ